MLPGMFNPAAAGLATASEIIEAMAANAGSFVSAHPNQYTGGGMVTWSSTQTFSNTPINNNTNSDFFRSGDTNDSTFTAKSQATSLGLDATTVLAWQNSRVTTPPQDVKINGAAAIDVASATYDSFSQYDQSYRLFKTFTPLTANTTTASADFQTGGFTTETNDKGGFVFLPGEWEVASTGAGLSGSGSFNIPAGQIVLLVGVHAADNNSRLFNFGSAPNLSFILNYNTKWYDGLEAVVVGNPTSTTQSLSYSLYAFAIHAPKPIFFKLLGG